MEAQVVVTKHAKKRVKQRFCKNYQDLAEKAYKDGLDHADLKGNLKKYVGWIGIKQRYHNSKISVIKVYNGKVFLFAGNTLITILNLSAKLTKTAIKVQGKK